MIELNIHKNLSQFDLDITLNIEDQSFVALSGKSGSGKTTILRILAGLEQNSKSQIVVDGKIWQDKNIFLPPQKREIGFVFQEYALFENLSVERNLLYVKNDIKLANHLLEITELANLKSKMSNTLSGGQKQRVALARAMMKKPKILLMDEPLSALDDEIRTKLQDEIEILHKEFDTTTIMVSHDIGEIYRLSDRVVELNNGKIINDTLTKDIFAKQSSTIKAKIMNIIEDSIVLLIGKEIVNKNIDIEVANSLKIGELIDIEVKFLK